MDCCDIFDVFDEKNNLIKEYTYWKLLIRNRNTTLGNCVAITKRHMESLSDITPQEMADFVHVAKDIERAAREAFRCDKFNYLMLMMKDKHTHFHILPRYASQREFGGIVWVDEDWPKSTHIIKDPVPPELLLQVKKELAKYVP